MVIRGEKGRFETGFKKSAIDLSRRGEEARRESEPNHGENPTLPRERGVSLSLSLFLQIVFNFYSPKLIFLFSVFFFFSVFNVRDEKIKIKTLSPEIQNI